MGVTPKAEAAIVCQRLANVGKEEVKLGIQSIKLKMIVTRKLFNI